MGALGGWAAAGVRHASTALSTTFPLLEAESGARRPARRIEVCADPGDLASKSSDECQSLFGRDGFPFVTFIGDARLAGDYGWRVGGSNWAAVMVG